MSFFAMFKTWDQCADYINNTLNISYSDNPTSWNEAMYDITKGYKFIKQVNEVTGETATVLYPEDMVVGKGEIHIVEDGVYSGSSASGSSYTSARAGGGAKSAPTAKSIITERTGGGTAVITDEAIGVKDTGLINGVKGINILSGLLQVYGLVHTGIKIANAQVWKDMSNYVYATDFTEDTPVERVIEFLTKSLVNTITDITSDGELRVSIPDTIATRLYTFLSNHMIQEQTPGIYPNCGSFPIIYNYANRQFTLQDSSKSLTRYMSAINPTATISLFTIEITDDLFKAAISDFMTQVIGAGFLISSQVATALLASMDGVYDYLKTQSVDAVENATLCNIQAQISRGSTPPPKTTPISLSEILVTITCIQDESLTLHEDYEGNKYYEANQNINLANLPALDPGSVPNSYTAGDCVKYLKRGYEGDDPNDYGYVVNIPVNSVAYPDRNGWVVQITYPSNEKQMYYNSSSFTDPWSINYVNGFTPSYTNVVDNNYDIQESVPVNARMIRNYSNLGYTGIGESYMPDDYLVTAGIRSKKDASGNDEKHPNPTKTKEQVYPGMAEKKQQANPQASTDPQTGTTTVNNNITNYVPAAIPFGSENAERIINHGANDPDDPESYIDNRSQEDKEQGLINTNDPVDGYNEDTDNTIKQYDNSRNDPRHYPDPIPDNEPNPKYPTEPPNEPGGETEDPPTPGAMEGVEASGMVSVYNPTKAQIVSFSGWLWSPNFIDNLLKLFQNPMDGIIGLHILYATPHTSGNENIRVGYLDSGVSSKVVDQQFIEVDCGYITIPEYYGDAIDYEPYVQIHAYLPFVGVVSLKPNDVIGKKLYCKYGVDILTGTCLAMLTTKDEVSEMLLYTYSGNCAVQVPISGGNYAQVISGLASMAIGVGAGIASGNPIAVAGGAMAGVMSSHLDVAHSGAIGANAGAMGPRKPHVIVTRKSAYDAGGYGQFYGFPANKTITLGSCYGYTRVKSVHIDTIGIATEAEKIEIESLLKQGVIIK